ncbi:MAG TPA: Crp/Fnr family transcriptional regulator, partial [Bacteroidia bacterium]|nr:Crp/Fnr family transcriptional regulator [Bacteroidia bacterium]
EGDFFGYTSLIEEGDYVESAQTLEDTEVVFIPKEDFLNLLFSNREIAKRFLLILNQKFNEQQDYLIELAYSSVRKRVAEALILLSDKYKANRDERFSMSISREDLANIVGTATESLIRTLSDFKEEKLIEVKDGKIVLINENKLKELKN